MASVNHYTVRFERDESGHWIATVRGVRGCHTHGRTLDEARSRVREALSLFVDDAGSAPLREDVRLPREVRELVAGVHRTRRKARDQQESATVAARRAARILTRRMRFGVRDAGRLLGLSHQRVHQLLSEQPAKDARPPNRS